jgi:predicted permease
MGNIILMIVCLAAGMLLRWSGRFPEATPAAFNGYVIHVALPAAALLYLHSIPLDSTMIMTPLMAWLLFLLAWGFFALLGRLLQLPRRTVGALVLLGGFGNTSFVGLPMIEAYYGKELLGVGILADQLGSFMALSTLGVLVASIYSSGHPSLRDMPRKVLYFPPFQALVLALLLRPLPFPDWTTMILRKLADTVTPLALVSVGFQLRMTSLAGIKLQLAAGLGYKLLLGPGVLTLLYLGVLGLHGQTVQVTLFEAAMGPMITAGIVAIDHDLDPPLVTMLLGIGIPLSFATLPVWNLVLRSF